MDDAPYMKAVFHELFLLLPARALNAPPKHVVFLPPRSLFDSTQLVVLFLKWNFFYTRVASKRTLRLIVNGLSNQYQEHYKRVIEPTPNCP